MVLHKSRAFFQVLLLVFISLSSYSIIFGGMAKDNQSSSLALPIIKRDALLNGLKMATIEQPGSGKITIRVRVNSGAIFDLLGKGGMADLTGRMLLRGAGGWNAKTIAETREQLGIKVNIQVGWDATDIEMSGASDQGSEMFDLIGRIIVSPTFDRTELDQLKSQRIDELKTEAVKSEAIALRKILEEVFGTHPFGKPVGGTAESLPQITRDDLIYFYRKFYLANNAMLIVTGDITSEEVTKQARTKLGAWKKGEKVAPMFRAPEIPSSRRVILIDKGESPTTFSLIGQVGFARRAEDYFAVLILNEILRTRLAKAGEESLRLNMEARLVPGPVTIQIQSSPAEATAKIENAIAEITAMQASSPSIDQVEKAKSRIIAGFTNRVQSTPADLLLDIELYGLGKDYLVTYIDRVNSITPAEVQNAAKKYFKPQSLSIVVIGPAKTIEKEIKRLGTVTVQS